MSTEEEAVAAPPARRMRADAVRTRKALLKAAAEVFAEHGAEGSVAQIAARAGIGKGTVFRHFPTKEDLFAAIISEEIDGLVAVGRQQAEQADADAALLQFMSAGVDLYANNRALAEALRMVSDVRHPEIQAGQEQLIATAESLARRAQRDGSLRADLNGQDVMLLICGVYYTAAPLLAADPSAWRRYLRLTFDGMCATGTGPLPPALVHNSLLPTVR
ncbi:TetR/AcrR family transcriptional regulator [Streptomyces sp. DSM 40750]|uniref:TetR/AcrR family transcriptional regulator n=1 Tax=Streptomyces sp. DSM 40750 TaxID=2801030 RepID=UPI00214D053F|nr:TetR/AcrR family transcriptional regulator [Streptomyces sp. DSM 40750]UUU25374.1 TetR/AcrR family transcriptional regulator [Streptomyces sp. DSM 40750]